ncbi:hypothetical protein VF21_05492 [Pseudogymnoascus sp. 05NY08]|nr:hypothetical protein VF21_05492 [Pseudogymnoascus sp. 05NY08]
MDTAYSLPQFIGDLPQIREQTFKESTIQSAFQKAGIWPISCNTALEKLRTYSQPTPTGPTGPTEPITPTLPRPITPIPSTFQGVEQGLQRWKERVPEAFSSPSRQSYSNWLTGTARVLATGQLQQLDLQAVRQQVENSKKQPGRGRLQAGGELRASDARRLQAQKAELQAQKLAATEARKLKQAENRARKQLDRARIEAQKLERARKKSLAQLKKLGLPIPPELEEDPITDPEYDSEGQYESASEGRSEGESGRGSRSGNKEVIIL